MWYVDITGVPDEYLQFLGYVCVAEDGEHKLYRDYTGDEYVVRKAKPLLLISDPNDVAIINQYKKTIGSQAGVFRAPPLHRNPLGSQAAD